MLIYPRRSVLPLSIAVFFMFGTQIAAKKKQSKRSIGELFHYETSMTWRGVIGDVFKAKPSKPPRYKNYPTANMIKLPEPHYRGLHFEDALKNRRSLRNYSDKPVSKAQLSQLLFAAQGATGKIYGHSLRASPSAGALYPFEIYAIINNVKDLPPGIYHYSVQHHGLEPIKRGDFGSAITSAGLDQEMLGEAAVTFVLTAIFNRTRHKYGERGYRYVYIEAGHISQNLYLQAVSLGLGSVAVGAFLDKKINDLMGIDGSNEAAIYIQAVGHP